VRLDTANRSLLGLIGASLMAGVWLLCGAAGCVLASLIAYRVAHGDVSSDALAPAAVFLAVVATGAVLGVRSLARQVASSRRLARRVADLRLPAPPALDEAARRAGLAGRLVLVDSDEPFSFVYGALTPRVVVSRGLCQRTSPRELDAVLEHERYHLYKLDPLKVLLARSLPATFFYLPILRDFDARYMTGRELAADRRAVSAHGTRPLAAALFKVVRGPGWAELGTAAAIGGPELLDVRVAQLERGAEPALAGVSPGRALLSLLALAALGASFALVGAGVGLVDALMGLACAVPLAGGGWALYHWLSRRTHRPAESGQVARARPRTGP